MRVNKRDLRHQLYGVKKTYGLVDLLSNQVIAINDDLMPIQGLNCSFPNARILPLRISLENLPKSNSYMFVDATPTGRFEITVRFEKNTSLSEGVLDLAAAKNSVFNRGYQIYMYLVVQDMQLDNITIYAIKHALGPPMLKPNIDLYAKSCNLDFERTCDELKMLLNGNLHSQITALSFWQNLVKDLTEAEFISDVKTVSSTIDSGFIYHS